MVREPYYKRSDIVEWYPRHPQMTELLWKLRDLGLYRWVIRQFLHVTCSSTSVKTWCTSLPRHQLSDLMMCQSTYGGSQRENWNFAEILGAKRTSQVRVLCMQKLPIVSGSWRDVCDVIMTSHWWRNQVTLRWQNYCGSYVTYTGQSGIQNI